MARRFVIVWGVFLLSVQLIYAQDEHGPFSIEFSAGSGPIATPENLKHYFNAGFALQTGLKADASHFISFRLGIRYLPFKLNSDRVVEEREPLNPLFISLAYDGGTRHSLIGGLDLLVFLNGPRRTVRPYLFGGGGYTLVLKQDIMIKEVLVNGTDFEHPLDFTENENYPAAYAGFGLEGGWERTRCFLEAEYAAMLSEELYSEIWPVTYVEHALYSPHGITQVVFIHAGLRIGL